MKTKHVTAYGAALADPDSPAWEFLDYYDYIICTPGKLWRIANRRPELTHKCLVYVNFFTKWNKTSDVRWDILPTPHELDPDKTIYQKHHGGESYIYYQSWRWCTVFLSSIITWLSAYPLALGGLFLDEWTISHTWWRLPTEQYHNTQGTAADRRAMMEYIERVLLIQVRQMCRSNFLVVNGERIVLATPELRIYHESVGSDWNDWDRVLDKTEAGDFWQINSSDPHDRFLARFFADKAEVSVGMQPEPGVLNYHNIEDPRLWDQR